MKLITAKEAREMEHRSYNEERALKRIAKDIKKAISKRERSVRYEDIYLFDCCRTEFVIDHAEEIESMGYKVDTWERMLGQTVIKVAVISWE